MTTNCIVQNSISPNQAVPKRKFLVAAVAIALFISLSTNVRGQGESDPPNSRGGFVQQLRSLSEDALESLQPDRDRAGSVRQPTQSAGRATPQRTPSSARFERSRDGTPPASERTQPLNTTRAMRSAGEQPIPLRDPAPITSPPSSGWPGSSVNSGRLAPITTAPQRNQPSGTFSSANRSLPRTKAEVPEVHVADELPPEVRASILGSPTLPGSSSRGLSDTDASAGRFNSAPQVSRIPLPSRTRETTMARSQDSRDGGRVPATLVSTPEEERVQSLNRPTASPLTSAPPQLALPEIPSLPNSSLPSELAPSLPSELAPSLPSELAAAIPADESFEAVQQTTAPEVSEPATLEEETILAFPSKLPESSVDTLPTLPSLPPLESPGPQSVRANQLPAGAGTAVAVPGGTQQPLVRPPGKQSVNEPVDERLRMETPRIAVVLVGPEDLPVNKPADYAIRVINQDDIDLSGLVLRLDVPPGVEARPGKPTHGELQVEQGADKSSLFTWSFEGLMAGQTAVAPVALTANSARNFGLAMEWTVLPMVGEANMEIRAPALELVLEGPSEVDYGVPSTYRLRVKNPGTADARGVVVALTAESYGSSSSEIGTIKAGSEESIDVELTFNEVGTISIAATANAEMELTSATRIGVLVRRAALEASINAPQLVYHGTQTDYVLRITNAGNATAENVEANVTLPPGAKLINLPDQTWLNNAVMTWKIREIAAGQFVELPIQLSLGQEGANTLKMTCRSAFGLTASCAVATEVQAFSDLKLYVSDPVAPAPVGQEVCYELTLTNRGSKASTNVQVVAQFSEGIEPLRGDGIPGRAIPGQLLFEPIQRVDPGQTLTLKVYAKAERTGTHRFRAEVRTDNSDVRLVQEESTTYLEGVGRTATPANARPILR